VRDPGRKRRTRAATDAAGTGSAVPPLRLCLSQTFPRFVAIGTNPTYLGDLTMSVDRDRPDGAGPRSK
jgi:hypothetical protein